mmetsp:Transcript_6952/g.17776  ORF Transcript_6952/g.17776 Transcript_6952/m.17776 type:complete len:215 (-) Transcript_6952:216-860(-)
MRLPPVDDVCGLDALGYRADAAIDLRYHASPNDSVADEAASHGYVELLVERRDVVLVPKHARHVRHEDELLRPEGRCDLTGGNVGIHVQGPAGVIGCNARNHRYPVRLHDGADERRVHAAHVAHVTKLLVVRLSCGEHPCVLSAEPYGLSSRLVDERDDRFVNLPRQHRLDDLHGVVVRDTQAVVKPGLNADLVEPLVDLRPAAMDEHDADADA